MIVFCSLCCFCSWCCMVFLHSVFIFIYFFAPVLSVLLFILKVSVCGSKIVRTPEFANVHFWTYVVNTFGIRQNSCGICLPTVVLHTLFTLWSMFNMIWMYVAKWMTLDSGEIMNNCNQELIRIRVDRTNSLRSVWTHKCQIWTQERTEKKTIFNSIFYTFASSFF